MKESDLISEVTMKFANKFEELAYVKIKDAYVGQSKECSSVILITLLGVEEIPVHNRLEKIQCVEEDERGYKFEYFLCPPTLLKLSYMVTPYLST